MEDLNQIYKQLKTDYENLIAKERDITDKIRSIRDIREKMKTKLVSVGLLEEELKQLLTIKDPHG